VLASKEAVDLIAACIRTENGTLPDPGGWDDQAATFTQLWPIAMREVAHWRSYHQEQAAKRARK
jgi:hypothetical protein